MPPTRIVQGEARRYRIRYTKLGRVAYLGHLDLIRHLPRVFRRAGVELFYSVGYHPKPELSFGPALGLGIPSLGEMADVKLVDRPDPAELLARLQELTLPGIDFVGAAALGDDDRALGRVVTGAVFAARLPAGASVSVGEAMAICTGGAPLTVVRAGDGGRSAHGIGRTVDVRRSLQEIASLEDPAIRRRLEWPDGDMLRFRTAVTHEGSARPIEVLEALFGAEVAAAAEIARLGLVGEGGVDPLDLEAVRAAVRAGVPRSASPGAAASAAGTNGL